MPASVCFAAAATKDGSPEDPQAEHIYRRATAARILKTLQLPNGKLNVIVQGLVRVDLDEIRITDGYFMAAAEPIEPATAPESVEIEALMLSVHRLLEQIVKLPSNLPPEIQGLAGATPDPGGLADVVAAHLSISVADRQELLESDEPEARLKLLVRRLARQVQIFELSQKIESEVQDEIDKSQREFYLRERLHAIRRELGEADDDVAEVEDLAQRIAKAEMPDAVEKVARQELDRLSRMSPVAAEHNVVRTYLDWILDIPWATSTEDNLDIVAAEAILHEDHYDLDKVKKRILEYLAVRKLKPDTKGPILCFVGPPGVGKTSLGRSIARALGREFVRISLGGVHDEAEIRGHRRTYVGALPGRILLGLKRAGSMNPVFMLDEIDKLGHDFRGDPSSALLEVLDPEQNHMFSDHYLEVAVDLSKVLFIATGNVPEQIPDALFDRMEILELPGYTAEEKTLIAQRFLVPRQIEEHGMDAARLEFDDAAITEIVQSYTEEAGVRGLERQIAAICRAVARTVAESLDRGDSDAGGGGADGVRRLFARIPRPDPILRRGCRAYRLAGNCHRPGLDPIRRRHTLRRGNSNARQGGADLDGPARRGHEGIRPGGALIPAQPRRGVRHLGSRFRVVRSARSRSGRRRTQGRPLGGDRHAGGVGLLVQRQAGGVGSGPDR